MSEQHRRSDCPAFFILKLCKFFGQKVWYYISIGLRKSKALSQLSTSDNG